MKQKGEMVRAEKVVRAEGETLVNVGEVDSSYLPDHVFEFVSEDGYPAVLLGDPSGISMNVTPRKGRKATPARSAKVARKKKITSSRKSTTDTASKVGLEGKPSRKRKIDETPAAESQGLLEDLRSENLVECERYVGEIVTRVMRSMRLPSTMREEFYSAGMLGLIEAADRFDPEVGVEFPAFAFHRVRGAIIDYVRSTCTLSASAFRVLRALEASNELRAAATDCVARGGSGNKFQQLERVVDYLTKSALSFKLFASLQAEREGTVKFETNSPEVIVCEKKDAEKLRGCLSTLPEKERLVIEQYYFNDMSLTEVAKNHAGLSKSWVSRIHDKAIGHLRDEYIRRSTKEDKEALAYLLSEKGGKKNE